ncbi:lysozyme inhibitor LprI family protein [Sphingomonas crocodyli]|uniref:DUF1311 domain-containing protein n=1 Tax=Sphingomonas crocodyli TaxID=1979270 RepID=A0A437LVL4_9SPHN|nr:lysozyme inhibitor LprI family protein [Sphingomonas crocodyli]RVT89343.1 DUF1311 domain-containing protein [Sphingomonas crocodyli]
MLRPLSFLALAAVATSASAASFDCARARSPDEKAVCASRALNDADVKMATLYALDLRFVPMGGRDHLHDEQRAFLTARKACTTDRACLGRLYTRRIATLQAIIDTRVYPHGPF